MSAKSRLLVIKMSSLGDVVHALPAITDVAAAERAWSIDWVCEEAFADIPALHGAIDRVIPCALRRWRTSPMSRATRDEIASFRKSLRATAYDVVVDLQGLVKSAAIASMAKGTHHGYGWRSAREALATLAYRVRHRVDVELHAIERNRRLMAAATGASCDGPPRYGLAVKPVATAQHPHVVCLHSTSRADKLWPEDAWRQLLSRLSTHAIQAVLPWGNAAERARSLRLALDIPGTHVPERMRPRELATLFAGAIAVIGVDTGLVHLAAAVGAPALAIFIATDPTLTGVIGERAPALNLGGNGACPTVDDVIEAIGDLLNSADRRTP